MRKNSNNGKWTGIRSRRNRRNIPKNTAGLRKLLGEENIVLPEGTNVKILFPKDISNDSIITSMARELDIDVSIVFGRLEKFKDDVLGSLIINVPDENGEAVKKFLTDKDIRWEEIEMSISDFLSKLFLGALGETIYMTLVPTVLATIIGFVMAVILVLTKPNGLSPNKTVNSIVGFIVNILRSFPFIILMIAMIPLTRLIVGTSIGETAAIVPITIGSAPFIARVIESALNEVDEGLIEAARSFGATKSQIIWKVMVKEAMPSIISGITLSIISILGCTAMAGAVGAGGFGKVAIVYGYQSFDDNVMLYTVVALAILVQIIQSLGNVIYKN